MRMGRGRARQTAAPGVRRSPPPGARRADTSRAQTSPSVSAGLREPGREVRVGPGLSRTAEKPIFGPSADTVSIGAERGSQMWKRILLLGVCALACTVTAAAASASTFSNTVLRAPFTGFPPGFSSNPANQSGDSEPAITFGGPDNTMAVDGLGWLPFAVNLWKGHFGDTPPAFFGPMDTSLPIQGGPGES